jgi:prevent-host-death family protein
LTGVFNIAPIVATIDKGSFAMTKFVHVRDLKNQTTALLREVEEGTTLIVTRRGKPIAILRPFSSSDLQPVRSRYSTAIYDTLRKHIEACYPELRTRTSEEKKRNFERITKKIRQALSFKSWQEMDKAAKGDRYGLTR